MASTIGLGEAAKLLDSLAKPLELINNDVISVIDVIERLIKYSNQLLETADLDARCIDFIGKLSRAINLAVLFICKIDDVNGYISGSLFKDEADKLALKDCGADHDLIEFKASLVFIDEQLKQCSRLYKKYLKKSLETERGCILVETTCQEKSRKARNAKNLTRGIGGATTAAVVAGGGVTTSIAAGAFTLGVGTVVGLAVTAVVSGVVGIGGITIGSAVTHNLASSYKKSEDIYKALSADCKCLRQSCCSTNRRLLEFYASFFHVHSQVDQLERLVYNHPNRQHAYVIFENLREASQRCHHHSLMVQAELKKLKEQLELKGYY